MSDESNQTTGTHSSGAIASADVRARFPELTDLILRSESMNDGERRYWLDLLPVMTPEQIGKLKAILHNERERLAAIDEKYGKQMAEIVERKEPLEKIEYERKARAAERAKAEANEESIEERSTSDILKNIEDS